MTSVGLYSIADLAASSVYTISHPARLAHASQTGEQVREGKRWVEAEKLFKQAKADGVEMPILFADASDCSRLIAWSVLKTLAVSGNGTQYGVGQLFAVRGKTPQDLVLKSTGSTIAPGFIRPYAVCETPDFLGNPSAQRAWKGAAALTGIVQEGKRRLRTHLSIERNQRVVMEAKRLHAQRNDGGLPCEVCGFDFASAYGVNGEGYIEAHHRVPLSEAGEGGVRTNPADFAMVCANCHVLLHRGAQPPSVKQLGREIAKRRTAKK